MFRVKRTKRIYIFIVFILLIIYSCECKKSVHITNNDKSTVHQMNHSERKNINRNLSDESKTFQLNQAIVYKTRKNYYDNVPVILTSDKKNIVSYPSIYDVYYNGKLSYPTKLTDGYLLDNRGINESVAFTSYTYEEYSKLKETPSKDELLKRIIDKNPLIVIVYCGNRSNYKNEVEELNDQIKNNFRGEKIIKMEVELE